MLTAFFYLLLRADQSRLFVFSSKQQGQAIRNLPHAGLWWKMKYHFILVWETMIMSWEGPSASIKLDLRGICPALLTFFIEKDFSKILWHNTACRGKSMHSGARLCSPSSLLAGVRLKSPVAIFAFQDNQDDKTPSCGFIESTQRILKLGGHQ